jgi:hypothetical protein
MTEEHTLEFLSLPAFFPPFLWASPAFIHTHTYFLFPILQLLVQYPLFWILIFFFFFVFAIGKKNEKTGFIGLPGIT